MTDVATNGRAPRTRASAGETRKSIASKESSSQATKPGGAAFQGSANASPFSPYKNSPGGRPSRVATPKETPISAPPTPPASQVSASPPVVVAAPTPVHVAASLPPSAPPSKQNPKNAPSPTQAASPAEPASPTKLMPIPVVVPRVSPPKPANLAVVPPAVVVVQPPIAKTELQDTVVKSEPGSNNNSDEERSSANLSQLSGVKPGYVHGNEGRNRSPYKCNKCGKPKKGHVCTSVLVPQLIPMSLKPGVPGSAVVMTAVPTAASIPISTIPSVPKGPNGQLLRTEDTSFYTNWFEMAVSSLEFLRSSLLQHQDKLTVWPELRPCVQFVGEVQTRLRGFRDSVKRADQQAKMRSIPSRMRIDASEADAVETLLRGLSEARDSTPQAAKRVRSDRSDDTEQEEIANAAAAASKRPAPSPGATAAAVAAAAALAGVSSAPMAAPATVPASATATCAAEATPLAPSSANSPQGSSTRKRLLLATSDDDSIPASKSVRAGAEKSESVEVTRVPKKAVGTASASKSVDKKEKEGASQEDTQEEVKAPTGGLHLSDDSDDDTAANSAPHRPASLPTLPMLSSQPGSQPTASQTEELVKSMLALTPPASQEMPPPAPKLLSPVKRTWLASDELLRPPPAQPQSNSQPLSQLSDIDFEHAPEV